MEQSTNWKIVLIDDEQDIRDVVSMTLKDAGYHVITAENGEDGLRRCNEFFPQIVITDIRMPKMDGIQVLESIKKLYPDTEVIVVTAFGDIDIAIRALQLDASDFITKPVNDSALHMALKRAKERYIGRKKLQSHMALLEEENARTIEDLSQTISFQRNLIESSMDGILGCDKNEKVILFNGSMEHMLGYKKEDVIRKMAFKDFLTSDMEHKFKKELAEGSYGGTEKLYLYETMLLNHKKETVPVQVSAVFIKDPQGKNKLVCFFRDLRQVRRLEREITDQAKILHQDKMMSLGRLAASVVHEINNPLFGVLNYLQLMSRILKKGDLSGEQTDKFEKYLEMTHNETSRCSQIISSLLTFSRKSPTSFDHVSVEDLFERCKILCQHKLELSNVQFDFTIDSNTPFIYADFNQIQQCLFNLIFNAIDAMPEGGRIMIRGSYDLTLRMVVITVQDTGTGISKENLPDIFEPFFTTKKEGYGVGLGLSTVFGIIEHHHGSVEVESNLGNGATFTIKLPVNKDKGG